MQDNIVLDKGPYGIVKAQNSHFLRENLTRLREATPLLNVFTTLPLADTTDTFVYMPHMTRRLELASHNSNFKITDRKLPFNCFNVETVVSKHVVPTRLK